MVSIRCVREIRGHFNVLRGYVAPLALAGVKIVSDYVDNYRRGMPSEMGLLNLFDPKTGQPVAIIDAAGLTGRVSSLPTREQINLPVQEQLIVELYSK